MLNRIRSTWWQDSKSLCNRHDMAVLLFSSAKRSLTALVFLALPLFLVALTTLMLVWICGQKNLYAYLPSFFWGSIMFIGYLTLLAVRPSTERKDLAYFLTYGLRWDTIIWLTILCLPGLRMPITLSIVSYIIIFFLFFLLDMKPTMRSIILAWYNTVLLCVHFLPTISLLLVAYLTSNYLFMYLSSHVYHRIIYRIHCLGCIGMYTSWLAAFALMIIILSLIASFYTRTKHRYHTLFVWE